MTLRAPSPSPSASIAHLSAEEKRSYLKELLAKKARRRHFPVSFAQERLWFLHQLQPRSPAYNMPMVLPMDASLDVAALERTLAEIVRRHDTLRTTFSVVDGRPVQVIEAADSFRLEVQDLGSVDEGRRHGEALRIAQQEAVEPFDLAHGPVFRATLLQLNERESWLLVNMHHIVSDGWSFGIFMQELATLYQAFHAGRPSPLPELPIRYVDFAVWQRRKLQGETLEKLLGYWQRQLDGAPPILELPIARPRPAIESHRGATRGFRLEAALSQSLRALSQRRGVTLFMTLLAAFKALLYRYGGETDLVVGTPVANRTRPEIEGLIGFFINSLVLRTDLTGDPSFRQLLERVRQVTLGAFQHQELPIERLVEELQPDRHLSHNPLFQVAFVVQNAPTPGADPPREMVVMPPAVSDPAGATAAASVEPRPAPPGEPSPLPDLGTGTAKFDLTLIVMEAPGELLGVVEYNLDLFEADAIERMIGHYRVLLEAAVARPEQPVSALPLLRPEERRTLLVEWNRNRQEYPAEVPIHRLVEAQVERTPEAVALVCGELTLTYRELDRRANRLARYLAERGVGLEVPVGVLMRQGPGRVLSLLAILKAGGIYVPFDPNQPPERLGRMLEEAGSMRVLTRGAVAERLAGRGTWMDLDELEAELARRSDERLEVEVDPLAGAYVLYTSGSTGIPKGAMVLHDGLTNVITWIQRAYPLDTADRVLNKTVCSFDPSVWEILWALIAGAGLVVPRPGGHLDYSYLVALIRERRASAAVFVASALQVLLEQPGIEACTSMRCMITGGELVPFAVREAYYARMEGDLSTVYGPTETSIFVTWGDLEKPGGTRSVPIGRAIANTQLYALDRALEPVPIGVPGELHVGGAPVGRGYFNQPRLTAAKFVPDPFGERRGGRLYRTGDLVRYLSDRRLEFAGRTDDQVKLRGIRIEPAEVESALLEHPAVSEAAVVVHRDAAGSHRLVAHLVAEGLAPTVGELRKFLSGRLPEYMHPAAFLWSDALPRTVSGKTDRQALAARTPEEAGRKAEYVAPRNSTEAVLARIWSEVLHRERVGVHDNFFHLGGHSLSSMQVMTRIREALGIELPLHRLFEAPTIARLAQHVVQEKGADAPQAPPLVRVPRDRPLPLSFAQERLWFLDQYEPGPSYNVAALVSLPLAPEADVLQRSLSEIVRRHEALRTSFSVVEGEPVQVIHPAEPVELPLHDLRDLPEGERLARAAELATREALRTFDLAEGPLVRFGLVRTGESAYQLIQVMHHIVSDGWSLPIFSRELWTLYEAFRSGHPSPLPELTIQYADFASWQRRYLRGEVLERLVRYWKEQLAGAPPLLELPTDRPRPPVQSLRGATRSFLLPKAETAAVVELGQRREKTLFMTLLAAFQTLLARYSGQRDVVVGSPIANRPRPEVEGLIGFFLNTLVLRTDLAGRPTFGELLERVQRVTLDAQAHQDLPFEKLVEELQPERNLSHSPFFQVMFTLQVPPTAAEAIESVPQEPSEGPPLISTGTAKFDVTLMMMEMGSNLIGGIEYNTDLFDHTTVRRLLGHLRVLLRAAAADPDRRLEELPMLADAERQQVTVEWRATPRPDAGVALHRSFENRVDRTPEATAVVFAERLLSYRGLEERANRLAHHLVARGVGAETRVALVVERSIEMVVAVLAVLKAGGAYVPIDPELPEARLRFLLDDSGAALVLTQASCRDRLGDSKAPVVFLDRDEPRIAREPSERPHPAVHPEQAAYVIYTSGSTGRPKGVVLSQGALANLIGWQVERFPPVPRRTLQFASLSFDVSFQEMFSTWCTGGSLRMVGEAVRRDPRELSKLLARQGIERLFLPFVALEQLAREGAPAEVGGERWRPRVREVVTAGEQLRVTPELAAWFRTVPGCRLINQYGPSETHVVSEHVLDRDPATWPDLPPIGRPIDGVRLAVVDGRLRPVPSGVAGELAIGGRALARGYLDRPAETARSFVPDPDGRRPGERLYRSGDLARYRADGYLEFLGRRDHQVKVRGFRIELGEVETVVGRHAAVAEVAVVVHEDRPGSRRLIAYLVPKEGGGLDLAELARDLREELPEHMVPTVFVPLSSLPSTPSGKLDRRALRRPEITRPATAGELVAPRNPIEERLGAIWGEVLGVDQVGIHDNFFTLGGHSLLAVQVTSRIRDALGVDLTLRTVFKAPTIAELAVVIVRTRIERADPADRERLLAQLENLTRESSPSIAEAS